MAKRRKPPVNEFRERAPDAKEIKAAQKLAKKVSPKLLAMVNAKTKG